MNSGTWRFSGLIAPRACLAQVGRKDTIFVVDDQIKAYRHLQRIYKAAEASKALELDQFDGEHEINPEPIVEFLKRRLDR